MFCPNCGKELPETAKFCTNCGTALNRATQEEAAAAYVLEVPGPPQPEAPAEAAPVAETAATEAVPAPEIQPEAETEPAQPAVYTATAYTPPMPETTQPAATYTSPAPEPAQPAVAYQAPVQSAYGQSYNSTPPASAAKAPAKKSTAPMILTFVALGLAILIFLLTVFVLFPGQKRGDASLTVYDLEGAWNASFSIRGEDYSGDSVNLEMDVRMDMEYSDAYGYEEYMLVTMTPVAVKENGVAYSQSEMAELEGASERFYALLEAGTLHFYFPSEDMDILISVPMNRNGGKCRVEFDEYDYSGKLEFTMHR